MYYKTRACIEGGFIYHYGYFLQIIIIICLMMIFFLYFLFLVYPPPPLHNAHVEVIITIFSPANSAL
jgi:hypothetical protein